MVNGGEDAGAVLVPPPRDGSRSPAGGGRSGERDVHTGPEVGPQATGSWVAPVYLLMSLVLAPWIAVLAATLPNRAVSHNYRLAWVGFDVLLMLSMGRTAWLAWRRSPFVVNVASATAAMLLVDAWFDVTTASRRGLLQACVLALFVELPAAVISLVIAGRAQSQIARTGVVRPHSLLWQAWSRRQTSGEAGTVTRGEGQDA